MLKFRKSSQIFLPYAQYHRGYLCSCFQEIQLQFLGEMKKWLLDFKKIMVMQSLLLNLPLHITCQ